MHVHNLRRTNQRQAYSQRSSRNLNEIGPTIEPEHRIEVLRLIWKKEDQALLDDGYWDDRVGTE